MSENFLSRWSKRKLESLEKQSGAENLPQQDPVPAEVKHEPPASVEADLPLPTEDDLLAVRQGGDIKAFLVDKVSKELKNKAFKALFSRPEFNVMDGLDIYIDDYNKFTPLSQEDIGKMAFSKQLLSRPDLELPTIDAASGLNAKVLDSVPLLEEKEKPESEFAQSELPDDAQVSMVEKHADMGVIPNELEGVDSKKISTEEPLKMPPKEPG